MAEHPEERRPLELARDWHVSPKRFLGWEPAWETVYEYDDAGRLVRSVTRQVEAEWDDATRAQVEALALYDAECCPGCGLHRSVIDDFDNHHFTFEERFCPACAAQQRYGRVVAQRDDDATPKDNHGHPAWDSPRTPRPDDGRHLFVRELTPAEVEKMREGRDARQSPRKRRG